MKRRNGSRSESRISPLALLVCAVLLAGCDSTGPPVASITNLTPNLAATVGSTVPVRVRLDDEFGSPIEGISVEFSPSSGEGSASPRSAISDVAGVASTLWTLGTTSGSQALGVGGGERSITVQAEAAPGPPAALTLAAGGGQAGPVGQALPTPISVKAQDEFGNGAPQVSVALEVIEGGGSVSPEEAVSNESGLATTTWTMGTVTGPNTLAVSSDGLASIQITTTATPGPPAQIAIVSGDDQSGEVGLELTSPIVVELRDQFDNLVPGGSVTFEGDGSVDTTPATADESGRGSATWRLGSSAGPQSMDASVGDQSVTFSALANSGPPSTVGSVSGDDQRGFAGVDLAEPPTVMVADSFGNGVPEIDVGFQVTGGGGSVGSASVETDTAGIASTSWTLGTSIGDNALEVRVEGFDPVQFAATATSGPPASITKVSGDGQSVEVGTLLSDPLVFRVEDLFGNLVEGAVLQAVVVSGGGTPDPAAPTTDSAGLAEVRWTLGGAAGTQVLEVRVGSITPASFTAVGQPGPPTSMTKAAGDGQTSAVGTQVPVRPAVRVSDSFGNPVRDHAWGAAGPRLLSRFRCRGRIHRWTSSASGKGEL